MKGKNNIVFVLGMILVIGYFIYTLSPLFLQKEVMVTDDKNVLIKQSKCQYPNEVIGVRCCVPDKRLPTMCEDEFSDFVNKLNNSINYDIMTNGEKITDKVFGFSFTSPTKYYLVKDTKIGGRPVPYTFFAYGTNGETIMIRIATMYDLESEWNLDASDVSDLDKGLDEGINQTFKKIGYSLNEKSSRLIQTKNGYKAFVSEMNNEYSAEMTGKKTNMYSKVVFLFEKPLVLAYESDESYSQYVSEFDDLLNSFTFDSENIVPPKNSAVQTTSTNNNAPITIIEYADPSCPFSAASAGESDMLAYMQSKDSTYEAAVPGIIKNYVNTGKANFEFKYFPGHGTGEYAMKLILCADEQGKFWEMYNIMFNNQKLMDNGDYADLLKLAYGIGLDSSTLNSCLASERITTKIQEDIKSANMSGVQGTPSFLINGELISGAQPFSKIQEIIESKLR